MIAVTDGPVRRSVITALIVFGLALTGCDSGAGGRQQPTDSTRPTAGPSYQDVPGGEVSPTDSRPSASDPPASPPHEPTGDEDAHRPYEQAPAAAERVAAKYIEARENAESWNREKPDSWLSDVKKLMTERAYAKLAEEHKGAGTSFVWDASHSSGLGVKPVLTGCTIPGETVGKSETVLRCNFTDQVIDKSGKPVPLTQVPPVWPHVGPKAAVLVMKSEKGSWRIDSDRSAAAG